MPIYITVAQKNTTHVYRLVCEILWELRMDWWIHAIALEALHDVTEVYLIMVLKDVN